MLLPELPPAGPGRQRSRRVPESAGFLGGRIPPRASARTRQAMQNRITKAALWRFLLPPAVRFLFVPGQVEPLPQPLHRFAPAQPLRSGTPPPPSAADHIGIAFAPGPLRCPPHPPAASSPGRFFTTRSEFHRRPSDPFTRFDWRFNCAHSMPRACQYSPAAITLCPAGWIGGRGFGPIPPSTARPQNSG